MPTVSIVTPWMDHPELWDAYAECVADADELVIVSNGSTAENVDFLHDRVTAPRRRQSRKLVALSDNQWYAGACNEGIAAATGDIVVCTNNDIVGSSDWIGHVREDVKQGGLYGARIHEKVESGITFEYLDGWCIAATQWDWQALGGWNTWSMKGCYYEDCELSVRAQSIGMRIYGNLGWDLAHIGDTTSKDTPGAYDHVDHNRNIFKDLLLEQVA